MAGPEALSGIVALGYGAGLIELRNNLYFASHLGAPVIAVMIDQSPSQVTRFAGRGASPFGNPALLSASAHTAAAPAASAPPSTVMQR